ncbi:hypothetical protein [Streptomyces sp. 8N616]|uniref:hypothetical protein n=1 Tax=Streptomyces sp. 8N616 TaxID=3457414 RepID=UPI003FCF5326
MFEIRIICPPERVPAVTEVLRAGFVTGTPREYSSRDGEQARLYLTVELADEPQPEAIREAVRRAVGAERLRCGRCPSCGWPFNDCSCALHPDA